MAGKNHTSTSLIGLMTAVAVVLTTLILLDFDQPPPDPGRDEPSPLPGGPPELDARVAGASPAINAERPETTAPDPGSVPGPDLQERITGGVIEPSVDTSVPLASRYERVSALIRRDREEEARQHLRDIIQAHPMETQAYAMLAELHYGNDELSEAITLWEELLQIDPLNQTARARLAKARREDRAHDGFTHEATRHFTIKFEGQENRHLYKTVLEIMEEAYGEVGKALSYYPDKEIILYLYTNRQFFDVTRAPAWSGGVFDGKIRIPAAGYEDHLPRLKQVLFHEYVHAVIHQMTESGLERVSRNRGEAVPTWLHEGVAQYLEPGGSSSGAEEQLKALVRQGAYFKLTQLHGSFMGLKSLGAQVAYEESLSAVRFLVSEFGLYKLQQLLGALGKGLSLEAAMRDALFISYEAFQERWEEHLRT